MRLDTLISSMPDGVDGLLVKKACNLRYLTGFACDAGLLLAARGGSVFFTDSRFIEAAEKAIGCCAVENSARLPELIRDYCKKLNVRILAGEASVMTVAAAERYAAMLPEGVSLVFGGTADGLINALRAVKSDDEVEKIKNAQAIAERAFTHVLDVVRPGVTERAVKTELDCFMLKNGAERTAFDTIAVGGKNSSLPHGAPSDRALEAGDLLTLDFGAVWGGYHSDMTRTLAVARCGAQEREIYALVLAAQEAALGVLRAGISCREADAAARDVIDAAGYGAYFGHGTGHGVGLEIHEEPTLNPRGDGVLRPGNVVTVEPGVYLPGRFGVRIEDMALITRDGCENLTRSPKALTTVANR